jgi:hypothetical protein
MRLSMALFLGLLSLGCSDVKVPDDLSGTADPDPMTYTDCEPGTYVSEDATETSDRTCTDCTAGTDYSTETNADSCTPVSDCEAGSFVSEDATATSDRTCTECTAGTDYSADINADSCAPVSDCAEESYVSEEATVTSDRTCTDCSAIEHCASGLACTTESDSTCDECDEGYDLSDDEMTCDEALGGHVVLIGHDYWATNDSQDLILGNAVLLANTTDTIQIVAYTEYADLDEEYANVLDALDWTLASAGRSYSVTELSDDLDLDLSGAHVLLIPEQESASSTALEDVGALWNDELSAFADAGGVVIANDFVWSDGGTWKTIAGLFPTPPTGTTAVSHSTVTIADPSSPLVEGIEVSSYSAMGGTVSFSGDPSGTAVVTSDDGTPVVLHLER